jgi:hypothetical protein
MFTAYVACSHWVACAHMTVSCLPPPPQVHEAIRANPLHEKKARSKPADAKRWQPAKSTYEERKERLKVSGDTGGAMMVSGVWPKLLCSCCVALVPSTQASFHCILAKPSQPHQ